MRLGVSTDFGTNNCSDFIKANKELGLGSVVFPLNAYAKEEKIEEYANACKKEDIVIAEVGIWRNAIDQDPKAQEENIKYSIDQLLLAEKIGARCCVNVVGAYSGLRWDGPHKDNFSKEAWKKSVKMIQKVIDEVNPKNTYFTIEPMPWMIPTGPEEYLHLIEDVDRDRFAVHLDVVNMINCPERYFYKEEFIDKCFELLKGKIRSCHLKDVNLLDDYTFQLRECACGEGTLPIEMYVEHALSEDKDMSIIIEHLHSNEEYCQSVKYVKNRLGVI